MSRYEGELTPNFIFSIKHDDSHPWPDQDCIVLLSCWWMDGDQKRIACHRTDGIQINSIDESRFREAATFVCVFNDPMADLPRLDLSRIWGRN